MVRVILHGCSGKMGSFITDIFGQDPDLEIVAGVDPYIRGDRPYPEYEQLSDCTEEADVLVDFTTAAAVDGVIEYCLARSLPMVICTTGLSDEQAERLKKASESVAVLRSANMSLGVNVLLKLVAEAARVLADAGFDIEILEKHHNQKVDAPSGTALALADAVNEAMENRFSYMYDRTQIRRRRDANEIGIQAVRGGTIVGDHDVIFAGTDEVVEFSHRAYSRAIFAKGAASAAKFLAGKAPGYYSMADVIG